MPFPAWHAQVIEKVKTVTEPHLALRTGVFSTILFFGVYWYIMGSTPFSPLNKGVADTAVILIGLSMVLSSVCYFWDFLDTKIVYRKHLGLAGFAFAATHLFLSWQPFLSLFKVETWANGKEYPVLAGTLAMIIFAVMAAISNKYSALVLGGQVWRKILRMGYPALLFVLIHVILLKFNRWQAWVMEGFKTLPSMSLVISLFIVFVLVMRVALEISLRAQKKPTT